MRKHFYVHITEKKLQFPQAQYCAIWSCQFVVSYINFRLTFCAGSIMKKIVPHDYYCDSGNLISLEDTAVFVYHCFCSFRLEMYTKSQVYS